MMMNLTMMMVAWLVAWWNLMATNCIWLVFMYHAVARVKPDLQQTWQF
jgi:hypothetical protein